MSERVTKESLREIAKLAGLDLDDSRLAKLATLLQGLLRDIDKMEELDLEALDMEVNYDARWREK